ncbi:DUF2141 domain-containing protein [Sphingosinicella ginsenosidimutans]|uniref:DUF2141 domain-containing protein n=2 Tax=Allosphingosinicella ginsenosidimutans TaxID=1176539 RepID=A0A5C6TU62_9SPHN|nr:DUF2141 domain-containing protein [Sphingosinicella ginsenosidimutans]
MASISVSGIACAARIAASARSIGAAALLLAAGTARATDLEVQIHGLRNMRGSIELCLTRSPAHFPDCTGSPGMVSRTVRAADAGSVLFRGLPPGDYAVSVIHDENDDGRLNTFVGIPREGFGFSRNPRIRMGPPRFEECRIAVTGAAMREVIQIKYLL